jgi:hypothetical protein
MNKRKDNAGEPKPPLSEDWLAVILAFLLIFLAAVGVLGEGGIPVHF